MAIENFIAGLNPRTAFFILFLGALSAFLWKDRNQIERNYILFYRRTKRGLNLIDRIAKRAPKFWKYYGAAAVISGVISIAASFGLTAQMFFEMFRTQTVQNGPSLIAPGLSGDVSFQPGISFIPIEYWLFAIGILSLVHEFSHGIVARTEGFNLNSVGWAIFGIFPAAFVEPEGEQMFPGEEGEGSEDQELWHGGNWYSRLKVLCAGSFANYLTAALFVLMAMGVSTAATTPETVGYMGISFGLNEAGDLGYAAQEGYPAYASGMRNGTLESINGQQITSVEQLRNLSEGLQPNETVVLETSEGTFEFMTTENTVERLKTGLEPYAAGLNWLTSGLLTVGMLNLLIGLFNMLPIKPLDGGWALEALVENYLGEDRSHYIDKLSIAMWALLLATLAVTISGTII